MSERTKRSYKKSVLALLVVFTVFVIAALWFQAATHITPPKPKDKFDTTFRVTAVSSDFYKAGNNWLKKNQYGLWEMYVEGKPFERGVIIGKMTKNLIYYQEKVFTEEISKRIPSPAYLRFLKYFIYWFNRNIDEYVPDEFKEEIYGLSLSASNKYAYIGTNYQRILNYHSAHDIGHALQEMKLVGCTSFGVWDDMSYDSSLIVGRNFDFYAGDKFAENKIVAFIRPDKGYPFMMVTWGGMIGAVSGMNDKGLTVTINAAKSGLPYSSRTPVSILARNILQYAGNINDALAIARRTETFISESLLIGSAADHKAVIIEKSPDQTIIVTPVNKRIVCANHFQSTEYSSQPGYLKSIQENASYEREKRVYEDIDSLRPLDPLKTAIILRDMKGIGGKNIGMGNEKAINQLIAHHSVIFEPEKKLVWVSTKPWQTGTYVCYNLFEIFHNFAALQNDADITEKELSIPPDPFLGSLQYKQFQRYKEIRNLVVSASGSDENKIPENAISEMIRMNPEYFEAYETAGDYLSSTGQSDKAVSLYYQALGKVIPRQVEKERIIGKIASINVKKKKKN